MSVNNIKKMGISYLKKSCLLLRIPKMVFLYFGLVILLTSFTDPYTIKRISDFNFRYEFYTTDKIVTPKADKMYYWFKGGLIHNAQGGTAGALLDGKYLKMFHSNQLAEQGEFKNGIKVGLWTTWHPNGIMESTLNWKKGFRKGAYHRYDLKGILVEEGSYKADKKQGKWIDYEKNETIVYKKGVGIVKKIKTSRAEKFKLKIEANKAEEAKKALEAAEKLKTATDLASYKATDKANSATKKVDGKAKRVNEKALKEKEKAAKKAEKAAKGDSKIKTFLKKIFGKKQSK